MRILKDSRFFTLSKNGTKSPERELGETKDRLEKFSVVTRLLSETPPTIFIF